MDLHRARNYQGTLWPWAPCVSATLGLPESSQLQCFPHFIPRRQRTNRSPFSPLSLPLSQRGSFRWKRYCLSRRCFLIFLHLPCSFIIHSSTPDMFFCFSSWLSPFGCKLYSAIFCCFGISSVDLFPIYHRQNHWLCFLHYQKRIVNSRIINTIDCYTMYIFSHFSHEYFIHKLSSHSILYILSFYTVVSYDTKY